MFWLAALAALIIAYVFGYNHGKRSTFRLLRTHVGKRTLAEAVAYEDAVMRGKLPPEKVDDLSPFGLN